MSIFSDYPFLSGLLVIGLFVVATKIRSVLRNRRLARRKEELMEWLLYLGVGMDVCWKHPNRHSKDEVKKWIAGMITAYYEELKRREDG